MLSLHVKSLDKSCRRIEVPLARTMVDIMAELEAGLPDLHEAKLVQDTLDVEIPLLLLETTESKAHGERIAQSIDGRISSET